MCLTFNEKTHVKFYLENVFKLYLKSSEVPLGLKIYFQEIPGQQHCSTQNQKHIFLITRSAFY